MVDNELTLRGFEIIRLDSIKILAVSLMVGYIVNIRVNDRRPLILVHGRGHPTELLHDVLVGAEDLLELSYSQVIIVQSLNHKLSTVLFQLFVRVKRNLHSTSHT